MTYRKQPNFGRKRLIETLQAMTSVERFLFWLAIANFLIFVIVAALIGGDAISGTERDGRYFLKSHGAYTEVTRQVFIYSKVHTISLFGPIHWPC